MKNKLFQFHPEAQTDFSDAPVLLQPLGVPDRGLPEERSLARFSLLAPGFVVSSHVAAELSVRSDMALELSLVERDDMLSDLLPEQTRYGVADLPILVVHGSLECVARREGLNGLIFFNR